MITTLPEIDQTEEEAASVIGAPDWLSQQIIKGGPDSVLNSFNLRSSLNTRDDVVAWMLANFSQPGFKMWELVKYSEDDFGIYFELDGGRQNSLAQITGTSTVPLLKAPSAENTALVNKPKPGINEWFRQTTTSEPALKGNVVLGSAFERDYFLKMAIASRDPQTVQRLLSANQSSSDLKVSGSSFFVEKPKLIDGEQLTPQQILDATAREGSYSLDIKTSAPLLAILKQTLSSVEGVFVNYLYEQSQDDLRVNIPAAENEASNILAVIDDSKYGAKNTYNVIIFHPSSVLAASVFCEVLRVLREVKATTAKQRPFRKLLSEHNSVYLPGFPESGNDAFHISGRGDLSYFNKNRSTTKPWPPNSL